MTLEIKCEACRVGEVGLAEAFLSVHCSHGISAQSLK